MPPGTYRGAIVAARTGGKLPLVCRCEEPDCTCAAGRQPSPAALSEANMQKARATGVENVSAQPCASAAPKRHLAAIVADSGLGLVALHNIKKEPAQEPRATNSYDEQHAAIKDNDQAVAALAALADPAGAIAAAAAAQQRASAVPKHVRPASGNGQAVHHEVKSGEEDCEPVAKRQKKCLTTSEFVGVGWVKRDRKWVAQISHDGKNHHLGCFDDEHEAARAADTAARRLRGDNAHGGRSGGQGKGHWLRLNFPTEGEMKRAKERGTLLTVEDRAAAAASERQGPSEFVGVSWAKRERKWQARISHDGKTQRLGSFDDDREAARAVDTAARGLRGEDAHGGRAGKGNWLRLNFPTEAEVKRAKQRGALLTGEDRPKSQQH
jgi:hypothetical protein